MKKNLLRNFHVPLPEELYKQLRAEAERSQQAATALARYAIAWWLQQRQKAALDESIRAYAAQGAGTPADVDQALEAASVDHLLDAEEDL
jgi:aryl-alcohol dehydrogenase-like predicted oxidoreductase